MIVNDQLLPVTILSIMKILKRIQCRIPQKQDVALLPEVQYTLSHDARTLETKTRSIHSIDGALQRT
tara:strand:+ start:754 stop:954 length:201 start_codon:yes stop_codon:yes gene_type:complete